MKVLILDFPSKYYLPPYGYGGIERWLWSIAKQSIALGHEVIISGPRWRADTLPNSIFFPERITENSYKTFIKSYGKVDCIVGGHEYWKDDGLRNVFEEMSDKSFSFQLMNNNIYGKSVFDNKRHFLFCFCPEIKKIVRDQNPHLALCASEGYKEEPIRQTNKGYLIWVGRLDKEKSPHYAAIAAQVLKVPIIFIGKPNSKSRYMQKYKSFFESEYINFAGELSGKQKRELISSAAAAVYTCSENWIEAAGMIFSEYARSGIPIVGMSWRRGTAVEEAIDNDLGNIVKVEHENNERQIGSAIAEAISTSIKLDRNEVFAHGQEKFSPKRLTEFYFKTLFG